MRFEPLLLGLLIRIATYRFFTVGEFDLLSYKGNLRALYACSHE